MITVYVDRQGRSFLGDREMSTADLFNELQSRLQGQPDRMVVIKADRDVVLSEAVKVMDVAKAAGAGRLVLATEKDVAPGYGR